MVGSQPTVPLRRRLRPGPAQAEPSRHPRRDPGLTALGALLSADPLPAHRPGSADLPVTAPSSIPAICHLAGPTATLTADTQYGPATVQPGPGCIQAVKSTRPEAAGSLVRVHETRLRRRFRRFRLSTTRFRLSTTQGASECIQDPTRSECIPKRSRENRANSRRQASSHCRQGPQERIG